jgi:hypothetical protein
MKRILTLALFCLFLAPAFAQTSSEAAVKADKSTTKMQRMLSLSDDQKTKVHDILLARFTAVEAIKAGGSPADEQAKRIEQVRNEKDAEIMAILTPDQIAKYKQMHDRKNAGE